MNRVTAHWLRLYRLSVRYGYGGQFLRMNRQLLTKLFANPGLQKQFFPAQVELIERFLACTKLEHNVAQVVQQHLFEATLRRLGAQDATAVPLAQHIVVEQWQLFEQAYRTGQGVLLALSHYGLSKELIRCMKARGYTGPVIRLHERARLQAAGEELSPLNRMLLRARDLAEAHQALTAGGIAYILPDGRQGTTMIAHPFFGRIRHFRTGFAELALTAGSIVLPAVGIPHVNGKFYIKFFEPLDSGASALNRQARIALLVGQYAEHLAQLWTLSPGSLAAIQLHRFLYDCEQYDPPALAESK